MAQAVTEQTNVLPGEWIDKVKRLPGYDRTADHRAREIQALPVRDRADVIRGLVMLLGEFVEAANVVQAAGRPALPILATELANAREVTGK